MSDRLPDGRGSGVLRPRLITIYCLVQRQAVTVRLGRSVSIDPAAMSAKSVVSLSDAQRDRLDALTRVGRSHARAIRHARTLLLADASADGPAWDDERIATALGCSPATVARTRKRFAAEGLEQAVRVRKTGPGRPPKIDGAAEAHLIALACSEPPEGRAVWTVRLLADRFVDLGVAEGWLDGSVSHETVRRTLKKTRCGRIASSSG